MSNIANPGDVVEFHHAPTGHTTDAGVVIEANTVTAIVAYDFELPNGGQIVHSKEFETDAVTVVSDQA